MAGTEEGVDEGGEPACWLDRVCEECGRLRERPGPGACEHCGAGGEDSAGGGDGPGGAGGEEGTAETGGRAGEDA
ncbi:hypothetical protein [Kitasatospora sp. NPDC047058]|uniref:hypothetical protein n=1 Tax=Kitasatospora sp. NPDC047058 TaxID=3155620 RepID=UPI00340B1254